MTVPRLMRVAAVPILLTVGAGMGFVLAGKLGSTSREALPAESAPERQGSVTMVTTAPVTIRTIQRTVEAVGTLHGFEEVTLSAKVEGRVMKVLHDVSDRVQPGDVLLELDPTDYDLAVRQAERTLRVELAKLGLEQVPTTTVDLTQLPAVVQTVARQEQATLQLERAQSAFNKGAGSAEDVLQKRTDLRVAQAEYANQILVARAGLATIHVKQDALAIARQQLADTKIRVPMPTQAIPGNAQPLHYAVTGRTVAEGTFVRPGTELFKLVIDRTLKLKAPIPERYANDVKVGQLADLTTASAQPVVGTVTRINPAVDPESRTFEVEIQVPNDKSMLKPGSFAKVAIRTRVDAGAITVPLIAPSSYAGVTKVFLLEGGHAKEVRVTLGLQGPDWVEVLSPPLPRGATLVTSGQTVIADGTPLEVRNSRERGQ